MGLFQCWVPEWVPMVGPIASQIQLILIASSLRLQMEAGITLMNALESLSRGIPARRIREDLFQAYKKLEEGASVPEALAGLQVIPSSGLPLLITGNTVGKIPEMLLVIEREAQEDLFFRIKRLITQFHVFIVFVTGILVGLILVTFFSLLYSAVGSFVQSQGKSSPLS